MIAEKIKQAALPYKTFICSFSIKAAIALTLLCLFGLFIEHIPPAAIAVIWAITSAFFTITLAYPFIIKKINTKEMFQDGSEISKRINGRVGRLIFCFVISAVLVASLMIESLKWTALEWVLVYCSIPLYFSLAIFINNKWIKKEYKPLYQRRGTMLFTWGIVGAVLTFLFLIFSAVTASSISSFGEAFSSTKLLFTGSSSALMEEIGKLGYLIDGFTAFGLSALSKSEYALYFVANSALCASSAFALAHLFSGCSVEFSELKRVFLPIEEAHNAHLRSKTIFRSTITLLFFSCVTFGFFYCAENQANSARNTESYTAVETFIREQVNLTVYETEGKTYDANTVNKTINQLIESNQGYAQSRNDLSALINESYDTCDANIESYVTWYFRPWYNDPLDSLQRGFENVTNPNSTRNEEEYREHLTEGIDTSKIAKDAQNYNQILDNLSIQTKEKLQELPVYEIPDWLAVNTQSLDEHFQELHVEEELILQYPQGTDSDAETYTKSIRKALQDNRSEMLNPIQQLLV